MAGPEEVALHGLVVTVVVVTASPMLVVAPVETPVTPMPVVAEVVVDTQPSYEARPTSSKLVVAEPAAGPERRVPRVLAEPAADRAGSLGHPQVVAVAGPEHLRLAARSAPAGVVVRQAPPTLEATEGVIAVTLTVVVAVVAPAATVVVEVALLRAKAPEAEAAVVGPAWSPAQIPRKSQGQGLPPETRAMGIMRAVPAKEALPELTATPDVSF